MASMDVVAAGAVVVRGRNGGEVLLVHRPKYDDWAWPKGKQDPGEHITATATREVLEETGLEIRLGRPLPRQLYAVSGGRAKTVHYWIARTMAGKSLTDFVPNKEIDDVRWVSFDKASKLLTYADDVPLLDEARRHFDRTRALVVLRHGRARRRAEWTGPDPARPLTGVGREQARRIEPVLAAYGVTRVITSDWRRCVDTVRPYAEDMVLPIETAPDLNEDRAAPIPVLEELLEDRESAVLCTHRPVLPAVLARLDVEEEPLAPGEMVVCHHRQGRVVATERYLVR